MSAQLAVSEKTVIVGGGEEGSVQVTREGSLSQRQFLHLSSCFLISFLEKRKLAVVTAASRASK